MILDPQKIATREKLILTGLYLALGQIAPEELAKPIKRKPEHAREVAPPPGRDRDLADGRAVMGVDHRAG